MTEEQLIGQVIAGVPEAEEEFFRIFRPRLYRASMYFLGGRDDDAEDIVQDTFLVALPKLKDYVFRAPIYAWLRQICLRLCYARMRSRSRVMMSLEEDLETFMRRMSIERVQSEDLAVLEREKLDLMNELKMRLNPVSRQILDLRNVQGMSYIQISKALDIPMGTVMSRLARARQQLQKMVDGAPQSGQKPPNNSFTLSLEEHLAA